MQIELANMYKTRSTGERKQVMVEMGKLKLEIGALVFDLDKVDIVLGTTWLNSIGGM